jgi:FHS family glucose/mannose:H+ symporter-like MFS transporter
MKSVFVAHMGLVLAGLFSFVLMGAGQALYGPALPAFSREFGITTGQAGLLVSAHWVGSVLGVGVMYFHGDRVTPRMALACMALGSLVVGLAIGWVVSLAGALVLGLSYGASAVIYNRRFLMIFAARGPSMLALLNAIFGIGAIGAPLVFVAIGSDPGLAFLVVAGLATATLALAGPAAPVMAAQGTAGRFRPRPVILIFGTLAIGTEASLIGLGPTALIAQGQTEAHAAELLSLFFVAFLAMRLALVGFAGRLHPFTLFLMAMAGAAVCAIGSVMTAHPGWFIALGGCAGLFFPGYYMSGTRQMGDDRRVAPTLIAAATAGGIVAPVLIAALMAQAGDAVLFGVVAAMTGSAALAALVLRPRMMLAAA